MLTHGQMDLGDRCRTVFSFQKQTSKNGRNTGTNMNHASEHWHGKKFYFGFHYDLHAGAADTELGLHCKPEELIPLLKIIGPDFVQTDCKGHPGYVSWFSKTPDASIPPALKKDAMAGWREATRKLGMPLHGHYSGIWDKAAAKKHPHWAVMGPEGKRHVDGGKMCVRSPYLNKLLLPQMFELIDRYGIDGFWVDGDIWAVEFCYCPLCRKAFTKATGLAEPPTETEDPNWPAWWKFNLDSFYGYVKAYCDAVHAHKPDVRVCSNWLQTFGNPGEPSVPTDWISGDNAPVFGMDDCRCESRFISTRGKPWDIMLWGFYSTYWQLRESPSVIKSEQMMMQEAATTLALGGNVQVYEHGGKFRDGRLVPWHLRRYAELRKFAKKRQALCQGGKTLPQVAVLHSEQHLWKTIRTKGLREVPETAIVRGAVHALLECHYGVDILDEWALQQRLREFPAVVVPECYALSQEMVEALKNYVREGGRLLVTGSKTFDRFGAAFLGAASQEVIEKASFFVPSASGSVALYSGEWRLLTPTRAKPLCRLGKTPLLDDELLPNPAAIINQVGRGTVAYIPADVFRDFQNNRYTMTKDFIGSVAHSAFGTLDYRVEAPTAIDVAIRQKGRHIVVHFLNRASGIPNRANCGAVDEIPRVGPIILTVRRKTAPKSIKTAFENSDMSVAFKAGKLTVKLSSVHIHAAVVISDEPTLR